MMDLPLRLVAVFEVKKVLMNSFPVVSLYLARRRSEDTIMVW